MSEDRNAAFAEIVADTHAGRRSMRDVVSAFVSIDVTVPSGAPVREDGAGFQPVLFNRSGTPMLAVFSDPERIGDLAEGAPYTMTMTGAELVFRMPAENGIVVDAGHADAFEVVPEAVATLRDELTKHAAQMRAAAERAEADGSADATPGAGATGDVAATETDDNNGYEGPTRRRGWRWAPNMGREPGSVTVRPLRAADDGLALDRIGDEHGTVLHRLGTMFAARSFPPDRLALPRRAFHVDATAAPVVDGVVQLEESVTTPWFGQQGGAFRYRLLNRAGDPLSVRELVAVGVLARDEIVEADA